MIDSKYRISLDVNSTASNVRLKCKRGDTGRTIYAALTESGYPYHITDDCYAVFTATKPDGKKVYNGCKIEGCVIVYGLTPQTVAVPGLVKCEIKLYGADDKLITSASFLLEVCNAQVNDGDELESATEVDALTQLISQAIGMNAKLEKLPNFGSGAKVGDYLMVSEVDKEKRMVTVIPADAPSGGGSSEPGKDGVDGEDGGYYTPVFTQTDENTVNVSFAASKDGMAAIAEQQITLPSGKDGHPGADGQNGTPGKDGVSVTHEWDGTVLKVTSASGTSSADLKGDPGKDGSDGRPGADGKDGYTPVKGVDYFDGQDGTSPAISVSTITAGHRITITDANGTKTVDVLDGQDGSDASVTADSIQNALGFTPANPSALSLGIHTDGLVYLFVNGSPVGTGVELSATGDVVGYVDENNNIVVRGNLADGTYTLKYENADGTYTNVGTLEVGEAGPAYINLAEPNTTNTTDTTIWCNEARLAATGAVEAKTGYCVSNFVKVSKNQTLRFKNFTLQRMGCYNESKTALTNACGTLTTLDTNDYIHGDYTTVDGVTTLRIENANVAYIRLSGQLTGTAEDVIITVDQEIV